MALNLKAIKAVVADIDGVFSDVLIPLADGDLLRSMDAKDCFAFRHCRRRGLITGIISGGDTPALRKRCLNLGVEPQNLFLGARGKRRILEQYCAQNGLSLEEVCFIGDDIPDVPAAMDAYARRLSLSCVTAGSGILRRTNSNNFIDETHYPCKQFTPPPSAAERAGLRVYY